MTLFARLRHWWLRQLDAIAPDDGLCDWTHSVVTTETRYDEVRQYRTNYACRAPWHHSGGHVAQRVADVRP